MTDNLFLFLLDELNNIKQEQTITKPKLYNELIFHLTTIFTQLSNYFYIFYYNQKNEEMKIDNDEQYKLCKDVLLIRKIEPNINQSIFSINYNKLSESKQEILDEKYCCNICKIFIKQEKPLICYRCQKIFHQKCLTDWDNKKKSLNQKLSYPNCRKELPIDLWEKK